MRTAIEALFDAMVTDGWMTDTSGDVESPTGHFAYVTNAPAEVREILEAFDDVTDVYGIPDTDDVTGSFVVVTNNQGFIDIRRYESDRDARATFESLQGIYAEWAENDS